MTKYNSLNVKLSNSQLIKLKSAIKNETDVVLRLSSNMIGNSDDNTTDIKLSKTQLSKMIQSGGLLRRLLAPLLKTGLPLMKSVIKTLTKSVLVPL